MGAEQLYFIGWFLTPSKALKSSFYGAKSEKVTVFVINDKFQPLGECMSVEK